MAAAKYDRVCIVCTLRAPLDETLMFVNYHRNIGVDEIILFFDDPRDKAIARLAGERGILTIPCTAEHWSKFATAGPPSIEERQCFNATMAIDFARQKDCQWIIHVDVDELILAPQGLSKILSRLTADVVIFSILESVAEQVHYATTPFSATLFRARSDFVRRKIARLLFYHSVFFHGEYFRAHLASKTATRITDHLVALEIHRPKYRGPAVTITSKEICLLHFDCIDMQTWQQKWSRRADGTATALFMRPARQKQLELFIRFRQAGEDALGLLYRRLHVVSARQKIGLFALGMLRRISIDAGLFLHSPRDH